MYKQVFILTSLILTLLITVFAISTDSQGQNTNHAPDDPFDVHPLLIGSTVPDRPVQDVDGREHSLTALISEQPALIIFYRGGWCPFCNAHLAELASIEEDVYELGYQILAISPDKPEFLSASVQEYEMGYTLFSDSSMEVARSFGVAYREDDETVARLKDNGMDIVKRSGHDHQQLPVPAVFITNPSGEILFQYVNPDYRTRISGEILMAALRAFRADR